MAFGDFDYDSSFELVLDFLGLQTRRARSQ